MNARLLIVRAFDLPFRALLAKGAASARVTAHSFFGELRSLMASTRTPVANFKGQTPTQLLSEAPSEAVVLRDFDHLSELNDRTLKHEFNLLGSGWVQVDRGLIAAGVEGHVYQSSRSDEFFERWLEMEAPPSNREVALATWNLIDDPKYEPIDWHIDFKSGYRWQPNQWWRNIPHGHRPGVDIKVPWELARMQHLVPLALEAGILKVSDPSRAEDLRKEARSQTLDFIAQNSPQFGVNWRCAMDVAIRAANWVLAIDLFRVYGFEFDAAFYETLLASLEDHGNFITSNFEKYPDFRANHYLANICGLAFIALALPKVHAKRESWIKLATDELINEINYQFNSDGSNFEGSTAYHRLSIEMVTYAVAALQGQAVHNGTSFKISNGLLNRIGKAGAFSRTVTKRDGTFVQIGDNDSGRFFKIPANLKLVEGKLEENPLVQTEVPVLCNALFTADATSICGGVISSLVRKPLNLQTLEGVNAVKNEMTEADLVKIYTSAKNKREYFFRSSRAIESVEKFEFPEFGVVVFKAENLFLSFRCGPLGQNGRAGHDHDDQLSIELELDGKPIMKDPGTYLYTALPQRRNEYRSVCAHFAPQLMSGESADLRAGLFYLRLVNPGVRKYLDDRSVAGMCKRGPGGRSSVWRLATVESNGVRVRDWCDEAELVDLLELPKLPFSPGYGLRDTYA